MEVEMKEQNSDRIEELVKIKCNDPAAVENIVVTQKPKHSIAL